MAVREILSTEHNATSADIKYAELLLWQDWYHLIIHRVMVQYPNVNKIDHFRDKFS